MLTPQEIQDKKFEKSMFGGYDMAQIDQFLDHVLDDYTSLYKENATLKAKMRVLVDKIEEYRMVDEEMRKTLYTAQVAARDMLLKAQAEADDKLKQAEEQAGHMVNDARGIAEQKIVHIRSEIEFEEHKLREAKAACSQYSLKVRDILLQNAEMVAKLIDREFKTAEAAQPAPAPAEVPAPVPPAVSAVDVSKTFAAPSASPEPPVSPVPPVTAATEVKGREATRVFAAPGAPEKMETTFFEVDLSEKEESAGRGKDKESDTAKIYGDSIFTPKPRFNFTDLRFGANYKEEDEKK